MVCTEYAAKSKGGSLPKRKHTTPLHGQPAKVCATEHTLSFCTHNHRHVKDRNGYFSYRYNKQKATPSYEASEDLQRDRVIDTSVEECYACKQIVNETIVASCCEELFCTPCLCTWLEQHNTCPRCEKHNNDYDSIVTSKTNQRFGQHDQ